MNLISGIFLLWNVFVVLVVIAIVAGVVLAWRGVRRANAEAAYWAKVRSQNFDWYRKSNPDLVGGNGRVRCFNCGGANVGTERLPAYMQLRRHFCRQCGQTLFHSQSAS